jgi:hypothetical protein
MLPRPPNWPYEPQRSIDRIAALQPSETSPVNVFSPIRHLDDLLEPGAYRDMGPNGLVFVDIPNPV